MLPALALAASLGCGAAGACPVSMEPSSCSGAAEAPSLFVDCRGERSAAPTVILESGAFGTSADWDLVLADLAAGGRVCAYDRGGLGRSPARSGGEDARAIAAELASLLDAQGERAPVILVGHSNGALYIETFAALWPERVAGLVYVNGVGDDDLDHPALMGELGAERRLAGLAVVAAHLGLAPLIAPSVIRAEGLKGDAAARKREALTSLASLTVASDEDRQVVPGLGLARSLGGASSSIPTAVVTSMPNPPSQASKTWREAEAAPGRRASYGWILEAVGASHVSPLVRDRAWVVAAVDWLRSSYRSAP